MKHRPKTGVQLAICFLMLMACGLYGCDNLFEHSEAYKRARETKDMSLLKKYQTAASIYQVEMGRYGSLQELYEDRAFGGIISEAFYSAWDGNSQP